MRCHPVTQHLMSRAGAEGVRWEVGSTSATTSQRLLCSLRQQRSGLGPSSEGGGEPGEGEFLKPSGPPEDPGGRRKASPPTLGRDADCLMGKSQWFPGQSELQREQVCCRKQRSSFVHLFIHSLTPSLVLPVLVECFLGVKPCAVLEIQSRMNRQDLALLGLTV